CLAGWGAAGALLHGAGLLQPAVRAHDQLVTIWHRVRCGGVQQLPRARGQGMKRLGLVSRTPSVGSDELMRVAAAIDRQLREHLGPAWQIQASLAAYPLDQIANGVWPIFIEGDD